MGPIINMPEGMIDAIPDLVRPIGLKCHPLAPSATGEKRFRVRRLLAAADVHVLPCRHKGVCVNLVCTHTLNPLLWWPDMQLLERVEKHLIEQGASPCAIETCQQAEQEAKHRGV